jgi:hypothetical protein
MSVTNPSGGGGGGAPTDALYVVGAANGTLSAESAIPGVYYGIDAIPTSPSANNDEFPGAALDVAWTVVNQNSAVITVANSRISILRTGTGGDSACAVVKAVPGATYTVTAKCNVAGVGANYLTGGLVVRDSASGKLQGFGPTWNVGNSTQGGIGALQFSAPTTSTGWLFGSTMLTYPSGAVDQYLRITDNGTNLIFSISADGISFITLNSSSRTSYLANPNQIGFFINNNRSNATGNDAVFSCDWIRFS